MISMQETHTGILDRVEDAIEDIRIGKMVIVVDDENRENEGDFICAAECVTPEVINFMATHGRGLICAPLDEKRADELNLPMMVDENTALHSTAFTVSVDLIGYGCTTGISAYDRARGIKALTDQEIKSHDFGRPGHIFPLRARSGGVLRRSGHTEAAIDLARLAGFYPAGVLVEILNADGTMARLPQLVEIARHHDLRIISIRDLIAYRMERERIIEQLDTLSIDTPCGVFDVIPFRQITSQDIHLAFVKGKLTKDPTLVRMHSTAETGDILGVLFDDYGRQLSNSLRMIAENGNGVLVFLRHTEHAEAILDKLRVYKTEKDLTPTSSQQRNIGIGAQILNDLGIGKIRLITNNPRPRVGLLGFGLEIVETVSCSVDSTKK